MTINNLSYNLLKVCSNRIDVPEGIDFNKTCASMNLGDIAIANIRGADYHCIIRRITKSEAVN